MRNRRLLTLAVLAVALGFAAYAQAGDENSPYGTAVLTVVQDPGGTPAVFSISVRLWDDAGIGETAQTSGLLDFVIKSVQGDGTGDLAVTGLSAGVAPYGTLANGNGAGFTKANDPVLGTPLGIRYAGLNAGTTASYDAVGFQPVAYAAASGGADPEYDAAILYGVGTTGRADGDTSTNNGVSSWSPAPTGFAGDTPIVTGTYTGTGGIAVTTYGTVSFDSLPGTPGAPFVGPAVDANTFGRPVTAIVIQTTTGSGNNGGAGASANPTIMHVANGSIILGGSFAGGANVTLMLDANGLTNGNTSATFAASKTIGGLSIQKALPGSQTVDVAAARVSVYDANPVATAAAIRAMVGNSTDGLYSSQVNLADEVLVITPVGTDHVDIIATVNADINLDRKVDGADNDILLLNWLQDRDRWILGDLNGDNLVDGADNDIMLLNWLHVFTVTSPAPAPAVVPEPATMSLLCLGALGLLRRRRR